MTTIRVNGGLARTLAGVVAGLALSIGASASYAEPREKDGVYFEVVRYADLDLTSEAGAQTLYKRIKRAARSVCKAQPLSINYAVNASRVRKCVADAISAAVADINQPALAALHEKSKRTSG